MRRIFLLGFAVTCALGTAAPMARAQTGVDPTGDYQTAYRLFLEGSYEDASAIARVLAEAGHPRAQNLIGHLYDIGAGVPQDNDLAVTWYERAYAGGDPTAARNLGIVYKEGELGRQIDVARAMDYFNEAIARGETDAYIDMAYMHSSGAFGAANPDQAILLYEAGVDARNDRVAFQYALQLRHGNLIPQDLVHARSLLTMLSANGDLAARGELGVMAELGEAAPVNLDGAMQLYLSAAEGGFYEAAYWAAWMMNDNPAHFPDKVQGLAYCLSALGQASQTQIDEWLPRCEAWFGTLGPADRAEAGNRARAMMPG